MPPPQKPKSVRRSSRTLVLRVTTARPQEQPRTRPWSQGPCRRRCPPGYSPAGTTVAQAAPVDLCVRQRSDLRRPRGFEVRDLAGLYSGVPHQVLRHTLSGRLYLS